MRASRVRFAAVAVLSTILVPAVAARAATTGATRGGQPNHNVQPATAVNYIIAMRGVVPTPTGPAVQGTILGEVRRFAGNFAPAGWAFANGQVLPIASNTPIFNVIGTIYGGDGVTTFALPDLRGRTPIHAGQGPGLANHPLGEVAGAETVTMNLNTLPAHLHTSALGNTGSTGGGQALDNRMPSLALNFIISVSAGSFPASTGTNTPTFIGEVRMFAGNFAPAGWLTTDGQLLPTQTNTPLFSLVGTTYGGDGVATFGVPDLRGRAPIQAGTGNGLTPQALGEASGQETVTLTTAQMTAHTHTLPGGGATDAAGGGQSHTNMQPTLALADIFAVAGAFPSSAGTTADNFVGEVRWFAGTFVPGGWSSTDGQILQIATNSVVFALIGTIYGGDGNTTFAMPDLRGRVALHEGQGPGLTARALGAQLGTETELVAVTQLAAHTHSVTIPVPALPGWGVAALLVALVIVGARRRMLRA
jgi:microcystin-dependent protein